MKKGTTLKKIIILFLFMSCFVFSQDKSKQGEGRYQIVNVKDEYTPEGVIFLIDTETGKCWQAKIELVRLEDGTIKKADMYYFDEVHIEKLHETEFHKSLKRNLMLLEEGEK
ncbi:MAG TPA: hypothetical protein P5150_07855 [Candidatus Ratteibacteria bacterium]|nr:hypothetical protein [Candidatus Ratteibacteria bacterium]